MKFFDRLVLSLDTFPVGAIYRAVLGFVAPAAAWRWWNGHHSGWLLVPLLAGILLLLRAVPAVLRRLLPFSDSLLEIWDERRQLAKRYDSYQWQKLLWIGLGLALYTVISGRFSTPGIVVSSFCLVSGALGLVKWQAIRRSRGLIAR